MNKYYDIVNGGDETLGVAFADREELFFLPDPGIVKDWEPMTLELRDGEFADFQADNLGCRLCSDRLKRILEEHASPDDDLQWLPVTVRQGRKRRAYWILHFPNPPDIVNKKKSVYDYGSLTDLVLLESRIGGHQVFSYPTGGQLPLLISEKVKRAIQAARCTGMEFYRVATG